MAEFLGTDGARVVIWTAVGVMLSVVGVYAILRVRSSMRESDATSSEWMTKFRDLHSEGGLSDEEYRTIKAVLSDQLQGEIKNSGGADRQAPAK